MGELEDKIIKKVYEYETKHTIADVVLRAVAVIVTFLASVVLARLIFATLYESQTLSVLQLFREDFEVIRDYFGDVVEVLYYELPKGEIVIFIVAAILFFIMLLYFVRNFGRIIRKIKALMNYWKK